MIKRYVAEFLGTFAIVFAPVAYVASTGGQPELMLAALVSGLAVLAMVYTVGPISAAHMNPAVTVAFAVARRFPWRFVPAYVVAQLAGGLAAAGLAALLFGGGYGAHSPSAPDQVLRNVGVEITISFLLMFVVMAVATDRRVSGAVPAIAIGLTVVTNVMVAGAITGGSMNPARSFGPAVFAGGEALANVWLYLTAPVLGAILGALAYESLRIDRESACGAPNEVLEALEEVQSRA